MTAPPGGGIVYVEREMIRNSSQITYFMGLIEMSPERTEWYRDGPGKEGTAMAEKMLITQALDEKDLLVKKINDKIRKATFVDTIKNNQDKVYAKRLSREEFRQQAESGYQQILDLIARYQKIDAAIINSNANTWVETSYGRYTVAAAIALRGRLREDGRYHDSDTCFEQRLRMKMENDYTEAVGVASNKNSTLQNTAEEMRLSILGKESKVREDRPLDVVEAYVKENTTELADPLDVVRKIEEIKTRHETLLRELETAIKVSNATTFIEF